MSNAIPDNLPAAVHLIREQHRLLAEAMAALARINGMAVDKGTCSGPPDIYWISEEALRRLEEAANGW